MAGQRRVGDYAVVGDTQTVALIGLDGAVDWLSIPRFDSSACFAALLGDEENGTWRLAPAAGRRCARRQYRGDTLILETEWELGEGAVRVIDFMPPRGVAPDIVRIVEGVSGRVDMVSELRFRFDYGRVVPWVLSPEDGLSAVAGPDSLHLRGPFTHRGQDFTSIAEFTVEAGARIPFVLTWQASHLPVPDPVDAEAALRDTEDFWAEWVSSCTYDGEWRDAVVRSLITLKALTYSPTGGIVAAATTSLPETPGGTRNWDYRYCWLRDATFTLQTLLANGYHEEAAAWRQWLLRAVAGAPADMQIVYGVAGERRIPEWEVPWLSGFQGAAPVRVGNGAVDQYQLDVYGEVMDALHFARAQGLPAKRSAWTFQLLLMEHLEKEWQKPDNGLWEVRGDRRHFVHSKVMAWVAFDRAICMVDDLGVDGPVDRWKKLRQEIHDQICTEGYDADSNSFVQYYGADDVDASLLLIPHVGFLPPDDARFVGTVERIGRDLAEDGLIRRYPYAEDSVDGLHGREGAFLACSFWYAEALAMIGRQDEARELFERLLSISNDVGLLAEEYDTDEGVLLGNFPQAYSHVALVNAAHHLSGTGAGRTHAQARGGPTHV